MSSRLLAVAALFLLAAESAAGPPIDAPPAPPATMAPTPPPVPAFYRPNPYDRSQYYDVSRQFPCPPPPPPRVGPPQSGDLYLYTPPGVLWGTVSPYYLRSYQVGFPPNR